MTDLLPAAFAAGLSPSSSRWKVELVARQWAAPSYHGLAELIAPRSRQLATALDKPDEFTFSLPGRSTEAAMIRELEHEIRVSRFSDRTGTYLPMMRGVITQTEDTVSEQEHTVNYTVSDYAQLMHRRYVTHPLTYTQADQDVIVADLCGRAGPNFHTSTVAVWGPSAWLPLAVTRRNPDGTARAALSGQLRDRTYAPDKAFGEAVDDLAAVVGGFDWATDPDGAGIDIYYPARGVQRTAFAFTYGGTVRALTRTLSSTNFANYWRVSGQTPTDADRPIWAEGWTADAHDLVTQPAGMWQSTESMADVTIQQTLADRVAANLADTGVWIPAYTLTMRPGAYEIGPAGDFALGDLVALHVDSGRIHVEGEWVRVLAVTFDIGDDGQEDIEVTVGRLPASLLVLLRDHAGRLAALERR